MRRGKIRRKEKPSGGAPLTIEIGSLFQIVTSVPFVLLIHLDEVRLVAVSVVRVGARGNDLRVDVRMIEIGLRQNAARPIVLEVDAQRRLPGLGKIPGGQGSFRSEEQ